METTITNVEKNNELTAIFETTVANADGATIRFATTTDSKTLYNAINGKSETVKANLGNTVEVTGMVITSANVNSVYGDDNSEKVCKPVAHFYTADGKHITSMSNGIIRNVKSLIECGLVPTDETPIKITFVSRETKKGTMHSFDLAWVL